MIRTSIFVDGSNLFGSLKKLNIQIDNYDTFFNYIYSEAIEVWNKCLKQGSVAQFKDRVYWYTVGSIDEWNLDDPRAQTHLNELFNNDKEIKKLFMAYVGKENPGLAQNEVARLAWEQCFGGIKTWYADKKQFLEGLKKFHFSVQCNSDFMDIIECGHWKVDALHKRVNEKGLDTRLSVDIVTQENNYDIAIIVSGDADSIPSIEYVKRRGKHVGVVEFIKGIPPEKKGKQFSSKLNAVADFVIKIYGMDLQKHKIAKPLSDDRIISASETFTF